MVSNSKIDEILSSTSITDVVSEYVELEKKGKNYVGLCPFHADSNPSMTVSEEKGIYKCFSCGAGGNAVKFVQDFEQISFQEALQKVAAKSGIDVEVRVSRYSKYYKINSEAMKFYEVYLHGSSEGKNAKAYLNARGLSDETIKRFHIGLAPKKHLLAKALLDKGFEELDLLQASIVNKYDDRLVDVFTNRIIFPITDKDSNVVGFSGRIYEQDDTGAKYVNTAESAIFKKSELLYHLDEAKKEHRLTDRIVLMEGYMDVIAAFNANVKDAVATMGTAFTKEHAATLKKITKRVTICFDGDTAGQNAAIKSLAALDGFEVKIVTLPDKLDPDEYIKTYNAESFVEMVNNATDALTFQYDYYLSQTDKNDRNSLERFKQAVFGLIQNKSNVQIEFYLNKLAQTLDVSFYSIKDDFKLKKQPKQKQEERKIIIYQKYEEAELKLLAAMMQSKAHATKIQAALSDIFVKEDHLALRDQIVLAHSKAEAFDYEAFLGTLSKPKQEYIMNAIPYEVIQTDSEIHSCIDLLKQYPYQTRLNFISEEIKRHPEASKQYAAEYFELQKKLKKGATK